MSANRVGGESLPATAGGVSPGRELAHEPILDLCDGLLGEIGRRMHRFSWLRDPSAPIVSYLPLDSYYPGNRLVVVIAPRTAEQERLCREQVPAHGLHLLWLVPDDLGADPRIASDKLFERIKLLGPLAERPRERIERSRPQPSLRQSYQALHDPVRPPSDPPDPSPRRPAPTTASAAAGYKRAEAHRHGSRESQERAGVFYGLALVLVLGAETFGLVIAYALDNNHLLLALGLALDVCARGLGTLAAIREGSDDSAWACLVFGSPAAVSFSLLGEEPVTTEPAPLAGAIGALACALIVLWILGAVVGA
jgi:hypothetical protein